VSWKACMPCHALLYLLQSMFHLSDLFYSMMQMMLHSIHSGVCTHAQSRSGCACIVNGQSLSISKCCLPFILKMYVPVGCLLQRVLRAQTLQCTNGISIHTGACAFSYVRLCYKFCHVGRWHEPKSDVSNCHVQ
jgi:hypothetical protein